MMSVMPMVGLTELEELDPVVQVGVSVVEEGWVPVGVVVVKAVASGSSPGRTAEVLL